MYKTPTPHTHTRSLSLSLSLSLFLSLSLSHTHILSITTVFKNDNNMLLEQRIRIFEWYLKDHVTLKTGVWLLQVHLFHLRNQLHIHFRNVQYIGIPMVHIYRVKTEMGFRGAFLLWVSWNHHLLLSTMPGWDCFLSIENGKFSLGFNGNRSISLFDFYSVNLHLSEW